MKKAQMKIQEMAFVLVAIVIFFAIIALIYFAVRMSSLREDVTAQREESAKEFARKLGDIAEFSWSECSGCIDIDKVFVLKDRVSYKKLWDVKYLMIERVYPARAKVECTMANYPACSIITLVNATKDYGTVISSFIALCGYEINENYIKCELGKIHVSAKEVE